MKEPLSFQLRPRWVLYLLYRPAFVFVGSLLSVIVIILRTVVLQLPPPWALLAALWFANFLFFLFILQDIHDFHKYRTFLTVTEEGVTIFGTFVPWAIIGRIEANDQQLLPTTNQNILTIQILDPSMIKIRGAFFRRAYNYTHRNVWIPGFYFEPALNVVIPKIEKYRPRLTEEVKLQQATIEKHGEQVRDKDVWWIFGMVLIYVFLLLAFLPGFREAPLQVRFIFFLATAAFGGLYVFSRFHGRKK